MKLRIEMNKTEVKGTKKAVRDIAGSMNFDPEYETVSMEEVDEVMSKLENCHKKNKLFSYDAETNDKGAVIEINIKTTVYKDLVNLASIFSNALGKFLKSLYAPVEKFIEKYSL